VEGLALTTEFCFAAILGFAADTDTFFTVAVLDFFALGAATTVFFATIFFVVVAALVLLELLVVALLVLVLVLAEATFFEAGFVLFTTIFSPHLMLTM
jgi:hypothetical protein